jgi:hypothetical protein
MDKMFSESLCLFAFIPVGDRQTPVFAEGPRGDFNTRWALAAFVFISIHHPNHLLDRFPIESPMNDFLNRAAFFHVSRQDGIQEFIERQ